MNIIANAGCLPILEILEILELYWNFKCVLEILEKPWNFVSNPGKNLWQYLIIDKLYV
jgi:hypothetical protein